MGFLKKLFHGKPKVEAVYPDKPMDAVPKIDLPDKGVLSATPIPEPITTPPVSQPDPVVEKTQFLLRKPYRGTDDFDDLLNQLIGLGETCHIAMKQFLAESPDETDPEKLDMRMRAACALHRVGNPAGMQAILEAGSAFRVWIAENRSCLKVGLGLEDPQMRQSLDAVLASDNHQMATQALLILVDNLYLNRMKDDYTRIAHLLAGKQADPTTALLELIDSPENYGADKNPLPVLQVAALALYFRDPDTGLPVLLRMSKASNRFPLDVLDFSDPELQQRLLSVWESQGLGAFTAFELLAMAVYPKLDRLLEFEIVEKGNTGAIRRLNQIDPGRAGEIAARGLEKHYSSSGLTRMLSEFFIENGSSVGINPLCAALGHTVSICLSKMFLWDTAVVNDVWKVLDALKSITEQNNVFSPRLVEALTKSLVVPNWSTRRRIEKLLVNQGPQAVPIMQLLKETPDETWIKCNNEAIWQKESIYRDSHRNPPEFSIPPKAVDEIADAIYNHQL